VASVEPFLGETVWGVTYELTPHDFTQLDAREGYVPGRPPEANRYNRSAIVLESLRGEWLQAETYIAVPEADPGLPSANYLSQIINAATRHGFPEAYLTKLRSFAVETAV
jgi:hypothetical protein